MGTGDDDDDDDTDEHDEPVCKVELLMRPAAFERLKEVLASDKGGWEGTD